MAIFYMNVKIIGRSAGRTADAYRAGERMVDERTGQVFDYTRRRGEIESAIVAPPGSPSWAHDRAQPWNAVEKAERRSDAQVARETVVAFAKELSKEQQRELIAGYVQEQFVALGMVADVAIHRNPGNPHAHIMLTMREMGPDGLSNNRKDRENRLLKQLEELQEALRADGDLETLRPAWNGLTLEQKKALLVEFIVKVTAYRKKGAEETDVEIVWRQGAREVKEGAVPKVI